MPDQNRSTIAPWQVPGAAPRGQSATQTERANLGAGRAPDDNGANGTAPAFDVAAFNTPPPGVPKSYWDMMIKEATDKKDKNWASLMDPSRAFANAGGRWRDKADFFRWVQRQAVERYAREPDAVKKKYVDADANGGQNPNSP